MTHHHLKVGDHAVEFTLKNQQNEKIPHTFMKSALGDRLVGVENSELWEER